jgi:hypothetical protein
VNVNNRKPTHFSCSFSHCRINIDKNKIYLNLLWNKLEKLAKGLLFCLFLNFILIGLSLGKFQGFLFYTVTVSYSLLYMNQVPGDCYIHTRWTKQNNICISLFYSKCNYRLLYCCGLVLLMKEIRVPGDDHWLISSHCQNIK